MIHKYYMQRTVDGVLEEPVSLEDFFPGMIYLKCEGLSDKGKVKNIYIESYAESEELRIHMPDKPKRESTEIEFTFGFQGKERRDVLDRFIDFVSGHRIKYWDTARNREVDMIQEEEIKIPTDDDILKGDLKYIVVPVKFRNIRGETKKKI